MSLRREAASDEEASEEERLQSGAEDASDGAFSDSEAEEEPAPAPALQRDGSEEQGSPRKGAPPPHALAGLLSGRTAQWSASVPQRAAGMRCKWAAALVQLIPDRPVLIAPGHTCQD